VVWSGVAKKIGIVVVAIAAVVAAGWWWRSSGRSSQPAQTAQKGSGAPENESGSNRAEAARRVIAPARLEGKVSGADGVAIPGAVVVAFTRAGAPIIVDGRVDGGFAFEPLPPGVYTVAASAPGCLPQAQLAVALRRGETTRVELALGLGGGALGGTVSDASGGPIVGATVVASLRGRSGAAAFTDDAGRYALSLAPGRLTVDVRHPEYVSASAFIMVAAVELT